MRKGLQTGEGMSTKIYTGFRFTSPDLNQVYSNIRAFRDYVRPLAKRMVRRYAVQAAVTEHDYWEYSGRTRHEDTSFLFNIIDDLMSRQRKIETTHQRDPVVDFSLEIAVLPIRGAVLGIFYTEQAAFDRLIRRQPWFKEYGYWNNTDRPSHVSKYAWETRRKNWELATGQDRVSCSSLTAEIVPVEFSVSIFPRDLSMQQSVDARAKHLAKEKVYSEWLLLEMIEINDRNVFSVLSKFNDLVSDGGALHLSYQNAVTAFAGKLRRLTFKDITHLLPL